MDELFEAAVLIQTGKIQGFPVVIFGRDYWRPLFDLLREMVREGTIGASDLDMLLLTDSVDEAIAHVEKHAVEEFGLVRTQAPRRSRLLGERGSPAR